MPSNDPGRITTDERSQDLDEVVAKLRSELSQAQSVIDGLEAALISSRLIGTAIGILMHAHKITVNSAFDSLVQASQQANRKLRDVAQEVLETGVLPDPPARPGASSRRHRVVHAPDHATHTHRAR